jgi:hypothetical protein
MSDIKNMDKVLLGLVIVLIFVSIMVAITLDRKESLAIEAPASLDFKSCLWGCDRGGGMKRFCEEVCERGKDNDSVRPMDEG